MANGKKSFLLYCDLIHTFDELSDEEAGKLIKHVLAYVNDQDPQTDDKLIKIAFEPIKQQLKRDLKHWETIVEKRSIAGRASAEARQQKSTHVQSVEQTPTNSTVIDNVTVTVNDTVTVNENLSRSPKKEDVQRVFLQQGGTLQMAEQFYNTHEATAWTGRNGQPIRNFAPLVANYIINWKNNENGKENKRTVTDSARPGATDYTVKL